MSSFSTNPNNILCEYRQLLYIFNDMNDNLRHLKGTDFATLGLSPAQRELICVGIKFQLKHNYPQINAENFGDLGIDGLKFEEIMKAPTLRVSDYNNTETNHSPQTCIFNHSIFQALLTGYMTYNHMNNITTQEWLLQLLTNDKLVNQEEEKFLAKVILTEPELILNIKNYNNSPLLDKINPEHYIQALTLHPDLVTKFVNGSIFSALDLSDQMTIISKSNPAFVKELDKNVANKLISAAMDEAIHHTNKLDDSLTISALDVLRPHMKLYELSKQYFIPNSKSPLPHELVYKIMQDVNMADIITMHNMVNAYDPDKTDQMDLAG